MHSSSIQTITQTQTITKKENFMKVGELKQYSIYLIEKDYYIFDEISNKINDIPIRHIHNVQDTNVANFSSKNISIYIIDTSFFHSSIELKNYIQKNSHLFEKDKYIICILHGNMHDYMEIVYEYKIHYIIQNLDNLRRDLLYIIYSITTQNFMGVHSYFDKIKNSNHINFPKNLNSKVLYKMRIQNFAKLYPILNNICELLFSKFIENTNSVRFILEELVMNAIFRAPIQNSKKKNADKMIPGKLISFVLNREIIKNEVIEIEYGYWKNNIILLVRDYYGSIKAEEIIHRIKRHTVLSGKLPEGITDKHGRGLFLISKMVDYLIVNVKDYIQTEVICIYNPRKKKPDKNIFINSFTTQS